MVLLMINYMEIKMLHIRKIVFLITTFLVMVSCKDKYPDIDCYRSQRHYIFYYDDEFHNCYGFTGFKKDSLGGLINEKMKWINDSLFTINANHVNRFDTVFYANQISCTGDKCFVFNGIFNFDNWKIGLYYPYELKGTYSFVISESEKYLFNYAVSLLNQKVPFVIPSTPSSRESSATSISYIKLQGKKEEKDFFADMETVPDEYDFVNAVIMTIVGNNIHPKSKISDKIGCLKSRNFYDILSEKHNTGDKLMDIEIETRMMDSIFYNYPHR